MKTLPFTYLRHYIILRVSFLEKCKRKTYDHLSSEKRGQQGMFKLKSNKWYYVHQLKKDTRLTLFKVRFSIWKTDSFKKLFEVRFSIWKTDLFKKLFEIRFSIWDIVLSLLNFYELFVKPFMLFLLEQHVLNL